jgi:hypothetical protein
MTQVGVGNVTYKNPSNFKHALPLVRGPDSTASRIIHRRQHFCHTAEMATNKDDISMTNAHDVEQWHLALTLKKR